MWKSKPIILYILITTCVFYSGCASEDAADVNQNRIFNSYELFYDANEDKTYAKAQFKFGNASGTSLKLSGKSAVQFNGQALGYDETFATYQKEFPGKVLTGSFIWTDNNGKTYTNSISINTIDFPSNVSTISRSNAFELFWVGSPLAANENVTATIFYSSNGGIPQVALQSTAGSQSVIFAKNQLEALNPGTISISMDRTISPPLTEGTEAGGSIIGKYRSENANVTLQ